MNFINSNFAYISIYIIVLVISILLSKILFFSIIFLSLGVLYFKLYRQYRKLKNTYEGNPLKKDLIKEQTFLSTATIDKNYNIIDFNNNFLKESGYKGKQLLGKNIFDVLSTDKVDLFNVVDQYGTFKAIIESSNNNVQVFHSLVINPIYTSKDLEYRVIFNDLSNQLKTEEELKEKFMVDKTTNLATKTKLYDDIDNRRKNKLSNSSLIYISIDEFDEINEYFGLDAGNYILTYVSKWLLKNLPNDNSKLYKLDLNSFAIFSTENINDFELNTYLKMIANDIEKENFFFKHSTLNISFTLGAAQCKKNIIKCTYLALDEAKNLKQSYKIYDKNQKIKDRHEQNIKINQTIKEAIMDNRVVPYYQPIFNLKTQKIEKYEALIRIKNRKNEIIRPIDFLDIAKKSKLYLQLSRAMIKSSFEELVKTKTPISMNISVEDINDKKTSTYIKNKLASTNLGHLITFEILESEQIDNYLKVVNFIKIIKSHGCKIAIDDFGSGYSNFDQLIKLDADFLKIDGSLIKNINTHKESEIMTRSIVSFAKEMGLKTVAEFVSSQEIYDKVNLLGIDFVQGYHIGRPAPLSKYNK